MQIDNLKRGFSFRADGPLDFRLNQEKGISAAAPDPQKCAGGLGMRPSYMLKMKIL